MHLILLATALFVASASAQTNDWTTPCFNGECFYDILSSSHGPNAGSSGSVRIWGHPDAITDITGAAGWHILDCNPKDMAQNIRLVCKDTDPNKAGCSHLHQNLSPEDKIVRLPESCGPMPFARIKRAWVSEDQAIPAEVRSKITGTGGPTVHAIALDTDFASADYKKAGGVNFALVGSNAPNNHGNAKELLTGQSKVPGRFMPRNIFSSITNALDDFNKTVQKTFPPIDIQQKFPVINSSLTCPPPGGRGLGFSIGFDINMDANAHVEMSLGVTASGTILPPKVTDFAVFSDLTADLTGTLNLKAIASGFLDSGVITLFEVGVPGLSFPGILDIGPTFKLNSRAKTAIEVDLDMAVDLAYSVTNGKLFFPSSAQHTSNAALQPKDSSLKLAATPGISVTGSIEAHLIPQLDVGVTALAGAASATIFLNLDASAKLALTLQSGGAAAPASPPPGAQAVQVNAGVGGGATTGSRKSTAVAAVAAVAAAGKGRAALVHPRRLPIARRQQTPALAPASGASGAGPQGCLDLKGGVTINAGANADFFSLFKRGVTVPLFTKNFEIFKKCVSLAGASSALPVGLIPRDETEVDVVKRAGLICPGAIIGLSTVVDQRVVSTSFTVA